jgi:hydrogenase maturation protease
MKKILIAGIGNIFHGDDAFGCEVIRQLFGRKISEEATVMDFGIRSYDLAYALTIDYDVTILVDAVSRGEKPGTVFLIEPDINRLGELEANAIDAHSMNPVAVLHMAQSLGEISGQLFLVGCEPAVLENDSGEIGLSPEVQKAIPQAIEMIESLVKNLLESESQNEKQTTDAGLVPA